MISWLLYLGLVHGPFSQYDSRKAARTQGPKAIPGPRGRFPIGNAELLFRHISQLPYRSKPANWLLVGMSPHLNSHRMISQSLALTRNRTATGKRKVSSQIPQKMRQNDHFEKFAFSRNLNWIWLKSWSFLCAAFIWDTLRSLSIC